MMAFGSGNFGEKLVLDVVMNVELLWWEYYHSEKRHHYFLSPPCEDTARKLALQARKKNLPKNQIHWHLALELPNLHNYEK
jgi:hypothetical protein